MKALELRSIVATNIRATARRRRIALSSLADFAVVSRSMMFRVLKGESSATTDWLASVAEALKVEPWELLKRPPDTKAEPPAARRRG
ncbi:MAG: hypothetical protein ACHREM_04275 [Polyangiales bacterium]